VSASTNFYALTGFVRVIKLQPDCDFHVQVAQSRAANAPQVIVEVPRRFRAVQRQLMALTGMDGGRSPRCGRRARRRRTYSARSSPSCRLGTTAATATADQKYPEPPPGTPVTSQPA
jgi:hypothetical protein